MAKPYSKMRASPNPTVEKLYEGCRRAREGKVDLILAVGGGSVCDYAKAVSVSAYCEEDHGRNTTSAWKMWTTGSFRWGVY